jgi:hypothetical protein
MRKPGEIKITWESEPSPEAILRAQLRLLGWTPNEIARAKEELDRADKEAKQQLVYGK